MSQTNSYGAISHEFSGNDSEEIPENTHLLASYASRDDNNNPLVRAPSGVIPEQSMEQHHQDMENYAESLLSEVAKQSGPKEFYVSKLSKPKSYNSWQRWLLYITIFLVLVLIHIAILELSGALVCDGPPYLYVTHKDSTNILKFSRDGCLIHEKVLWGTNSDNYELRGMFLGKYNNKEALFVANSGGKSSGVMIYGSCIEKTSLRPYITTVVSASINAGAQHAYSVTQDMHGNIYASFQNTDNVLRFYNKSFQPMPLPKRLKPIIAVPKTPKNETIGGNNSSALRRLAEEDENAVFLSEYLTSAEEVESILTSKRTNSTDNEGDKHKKHHNSTDSNNNNSTNNSTEDNLFANLTYFPGTFVQFGMPGLHNSQERGVRSIVFVNNYTELWVANEDLNKIVVLDSTGRYIKHINVNKPVGLYHSEHSEVVYVGSRSKKVSAVYAVDKKTLEIRMQYKLIGMKHPSGVVEFDGVLYVADQSRNAIVSFNTSSGRFLRVNVPTVKLHGLVENIIFSHC